MFNRTWGWIEGALPVRIYVLAVGIAAGLITGALRLGESLDLATAVGFVTGFSVTMGVWLGMRLYLVAIGLYRAWIVAIRKQIAEIEVHSFPGRAPSNERDIERLQGSVAISAAVYSIYPTPGLLCGFIASAIASALWAQFDYARASMHFDFLLAFLMAFAVVVAVQCICLLRLQWLVRSSRRRLNRGELVAPVARNTDALDSGINRAERLVRLIGGVGKPAGERSVA